jgi:hypothetical protein
MIKAKLSPCHLTIREIINTGFWYVDGERAHVLTEKEMCEFEQKVCGAHSEHLLLVLTQWIEKHKAMPNADALYDALFEQHGLCSLQNRFVLQIEEARLRLKHS